MNLFIENIHHQLYCTYLKDRVPILPSIDDFTAYYTRYWTSSFPLEWDTTGQSDASGAYIGLGLVYDPCEELEQALSWTIPEHIACRDED